MVIATAIYVYDFVEVSSLVDNEFIEVTPGSGLYIGTIGSMAAVVALIVELVAERRNTESLGHT